MTPLLGFDNLLERLTKLKEKFAYWISDLLYKNIIQEQPNGRRI